MQPDLFIREAVLSDTETIVAFNVQLAQESESIELSLQTLRAGVQALLRDPSRGRYYLACRGDEVVGQLMITTEWSDWRNGQLWWIQSVYVRPADRRLGVLRQLYDDLAQRACETKEVVGLRLYVEQNNSAAQQAYRKLGMRDAGYVVYEHLLIRPR